MVVHNTNDPLNIKRTTGTRTPTVLGNESPPLLIFFFLPLLFFFLLLLKLTESEGSILLYPHLNLCRFNKTHIAPESLITFFMIPLPDLSLSLQTHLKSFVVLLISIISLNKTALFFERWKNFRKIFLQPKKLICPNDFLQTIWKYQRAFFHFDSD